jgi:hypothetical protein
MAPRGSTAKDNRQHGAVGTGLVAGLCLVADRQTWWRNAQAEFSFTNGDVGAENPAVIFGGRCCCHWTGCGCLGFHFVRDWQRATLNRPP